MSRIIVCLREAWRIPRPSYLRDHKPTLLQKKGLLFEKRVGKSLASRFGKVESGPWFNFIDANGPGICQPDLVVWGKLQGQEVRLVVECKLTVTEEAFLQINHLYVPVVGLADGIPTFGIVIAQNLTRWLQPGLVVDSIPGALALAQKKETPVLHWLGHTAL